MNDFWKSDTYAVIKAMKGRGNQEGVIAQWIDGVRQWAETHTGPDAAALKSWLPMWKPRPFYTVDELAPMFPALIVALGLKDQLPFAKSPMRLMHELDYGGLPTLSNNFGTADFRNPMNGVLARYYIVERVKWWSDQRITQEEFENVLLG